MAGPIASLLVSLGLDARQFTKGIDTANRSVAGFTRDAGGRFGGFASGIQQGFGMAFGLSTVQLVGRAAGAVTDFVGDSIQAASSLNETLSKSRQIFGDNADEIESWGDTAAKTFGQSKRQAIDTASTFAGLFQTVGVAADESAEKSRKLTELGSDLASFFDTDVQTAIQAVRSGLSGESEPLRRFNVFLSESAVNAELMAMGQEKLGGQWTEQQKILGRYNIILKQTAVAQGDFERTSESLANKQRSLAGVMEDTQAKLGDKLLPLQLQFTQTQIALLSVLDDTKAAFAAGNKPIEQQADLAQTLLGHAEALSSWQFPAMTSALQTQTDAWVESTKATAAYDAALDESTRGLRLNAQLASELAEDRAALLAAGLATGAANAFAANQQHMADDARETMAFAGRAMEQQGLEDARRIGSGVVSELTQGMWDDRARLDQTAADLRDILENGLTPEEQVAEATGAKWIKLLRRGIESEKIGAREEAQALAVDLINSIEDASGGTPDSKGLKAIGRYYDLLLASGLTAGQADAALAAGGVADTTLGALHAKRGEFYTQGNTLADRTIAGWKAGKWYAAGFSATTNISSGIRAYSWYDGGWNSAKSWIGGFADKFDAYNWANLINSTIGPYTRGQSPPPKGPLHFIDVWGANVGKAYLEGIAEGLSGGLSGGLAFPSPVLPGGPPPFGGEMPSVAAAVAAPVVVNVNVANLYGGPAGLDALADDIEKRMRQRVRGANWQAGR